MIGDSQKHYERGFFFDLWCEMTSAVEDYTTSFMVRFPFLIEQTRQRAGLMLGSVNLQDSSKE